MIKVTDFTELYPMGGFENNEKVSIMLAHASMEFYTICRYLQNSYLIDNLLFKPAVHLPLMHQCIELLVKALIAKVKQEKLPDKTHKTLSLLIKFQNDVNAFSQILEDENKIEFIKELEKSYFKVRYGEAHTYFKFSVLDLFNSIIDDLVNSFDEIHGSKIIGIYHPNILHLKMNDLI